MELTAAQIVFYCIAAFTVGTGLLAVTTRKIFRAAIWLLFSLMGIAAFYFWLEVEFVAAVQVVVYVGGIVVLILFSIFLTQQAGSLLPRPPSRRALFAALAAVFGLALTLQLLLEYPFRDAGGSPFTPSVAAIGEQMLSLTDHGYVLPFEVVSILLLAAMVGCIVIAMKSKTETA
jgi:NADH-quinone oxidoreductase subunit J